jgi:hypothetical protein
LDAEHPDTTDLPHARPFDSSLTLSLSKGELVAQDRLHYLFGGQVYELHVRRVQRAIEQVQNDSVRTVRATFDIHTLATNARTRFEIACGTEGCLAGVPVSVAWQLRWWLRVSLRLID